MQETKVVKPAPGRRVRRPDQGFRALPEEGAPVAWSSYWDRLLRDGDIEIVPDVPEQMVLDEVPPKSSKAAKPAGSDS